MEEKKELVGINSCFVDIDNVALRLYRQKSHEKSTPEKHLFTSLHIHTYHEIIACIDDSVNMLTGDGDIILKKGDIAIIPPDYQHTIIYTDNDSEKWVDVAITCTKIENKFGNDLWRKLRHMFKITSPIIFRGVDNLVSDVTLIREVLYKSESISSALRLALFLEELSDRGYEGLDENAGEKNGAESSEGLDDVRLAILNDIVSRRYTEDIDPGEVADCLYISRRHLDRIIKNRFGSTLRELINGKRLDFSKKLLREEEYPLEKIAVTSGFSSKEVFCRAFKDKFGISPTDYRKSAKITQ